MPICCPTLRHLCNTTCENKEYGGSNLWIGCLNEFNFGITNNELTTLTLTEDLGDPPGTPTTGLVEFCLEGDEFNLIETGNYDATTGLVTWEDSTEGLKIYSATTADDVTVRGLLGKQVWGITKLLGKSGNYIFRTFGLGGNVRITNLTRGLKAADWQITLTGKGVERQLYATLGGSAAATEAAILALLLP